MRNKARKSLICLIFAFALSLATFGALTVNKVYASEPSTFAFENGAYVKIAQDGGLRYRLELDEQTATALKTAEQDELVFYVIPEKYLSEVTDGNYEALLSVDGKVHAQKVIVDRNKIYSDENGKYFANCLLDINLAEYDGKYNAVNFVTVAKYGDTVATSVTRNMYEVANACALDGHFADVKSVYAWLGTQDYPVSVTTQEQYTALTAALKTSEDYKNLYICLDNVTDSENLLENYANAYFKKFTVSVKVNDDKLGSVDVATVSDVVRGTAITVDGNKLTVGDTTITATSADDDLFVFTGFTGVTETVANDMTITANFDYRTEISTAAQFSKFLQAVANYDYDGKTLTLTCDIDMSAYEGKGGTHAIQGNSVGGTFRGTIDGQGYGVSNLNVAWSMFNKLEKAVIKNAAFNLKIGDNWWFGFSKEVNSLTLENVYLDAPAGSARGNDYAIAGLVNTSLIVKNSIINRKHNTTNAIISETGSSATVSFENTYVIGNTNSICPNSKGTINGSPIKKSHLAFAEITQKGLTEENGWNTEFWKSVNKTDLMYTLVCGKGEESTITADAYTIENAKDFEDFIVLTTKTKTFSQETVEILNDIDFTDYTYANTKGYVSGQGGQKEGFIGTLNGNGRIISNLKVRWTIFVRTYGANINNLAFVNLQYQAGYGKGLIEECAGSTTIDNVYVKATSDGVYNCDFAIADTVSGSTTIKNCVINKSHGTATNNTLVGTINGNASLTLSNVYSIGGTPGVATTKDGALTGGDNVIYQSNASGALTAITDAGLTKENGWNTDLWKIDENGNLLFRDTVVITKA